MNKPIKMWIETARERAKDNAVTCNTTASYWQDALEGRCLPNPDVYLERDRRMQYDG